MLGRIMMTPGRIFAGSEVSLPINFKDSSYTDVDPATVVATTLAPDGKETSYTYGSDDELTKTSVGEYVLSIVATIPGRWHYRFLTTGTGTTIALEGSFNVQSSYFVDDGFATRDYA